MEILALTAASFDSAHSFLRHGCCESPSSWEPQEEGMMSKAASFPLVRNQGLSNPGKSQTPKGDAC
jgi:hypothetical protein